ncbi:MAG TPA: exosortase A [Candidatus Acidoferrales bacterium]|nr:exosortase A [Candidatus Acidoferrales bacterium]
MADSSVTPTVFTKERAERQVPWGVWISVFSVLLLVLYGPILKALVLDWWRDPNYGHGFLVPILAGYVLWKERVRLGRIAIRPSNFGLVVMLGAIGLLLIGSLGAELFSSRISLIFLLGGMVIFLAGWKMLRAVSFPLGFLVLMIPIPVLIYNQITFPLQLLASRFATFWLQLVNVPVLREGNLIILPNYTLEVVEACSGIRSLMTLITLAVAYGYLMQDRRWLRWVLALIMIPIAIVSNAIRIMGAGLLTYHFGHEMAEGFFHEFSGWVIFLAALVLMFGCHWLLRKIPGSKKEEHADD